jgi:hypothetical protein
MSVNSLLKWLKIEFAAVAAAKCLLTHLDGFREPSRLEKTKKALKVTKWLLICCYVLQLAA